MAMIGCGRCMKLTAHLDIAHPDVFHCFDCDQERIWGSSIDWQTPDHLAEDRGGMYELLRAPSAYGPNSLKFVLRSKPQP